MLLVLLYHKIGQGKYSTDLKDFVKQLLYIKKKYNIVHPGDKLKKKINICITFDDADISFYKDVFPLIKKYNIKVTLAIPVNFIKNDNNSADFCSWDMIKEMSKSPFLKFASHSYSHVNLTSTDINLQKEIIQSKEILENFLDKKINTFIYPFGKFNRKVHKFAKKNYKYIMRIGSCYNLSWINLNKIIYRLPFDNIKNFKKKFNFVSLLKYTCGYILNVIRGR